MNDGLKSGTLADTSPEPKGLNIVTCGGVEQDGRIL